MKNISLDLVLLSFMPAILLGGIIWFIVQVYFEKFKVLLKTSQQNTLMPQRAQAYERFAIFLERIDLAHLVERIKPQSDDVTQYAKILIGIVDQEFEYNASQQIYIDEKSLEAIKTALHQTQELIKREKEGQTDARALQQRLYHVAMNNPEGMPSRKATKILIKYFR